MPKKSRSSIDSKTKPATGPVALLIGTRKGAFMLRGDQKRQSWKLSDPIFLGHIAHHFVLDPRDNRTMLIAARTGHLGPTVFRSTDFGKTWKRQDQGLPRSQAWFTVKRQAMTADAHKPVGVYFGTTSGEIWACLPDIYPRFTLSRLPNCLDEGLYSNSSTVLYKTTG